MFALKRSVRIHSVQKFVPGIPLRVRCPPRHAIRPRPSEWQRTFYQSSRAAAKRVIKKKEQELLQGPIGEGSLPPSEKSDLKPDSLMDVVDDCMRRFPNCVLLTKVGNFYEVGSMLNSGRLTEDLSCIANMQSNMDQSSICALPPRGKTEHPWPASSYHN